MRLNRFNNDEAGLPQQSLRFVADALAMLQAARRVIGNGQLGCFTCRRIADAGEELADVTGQRRYVRGASSPRFRIPMR